MAAFHPKPPRQLSTHCRHLLGGYGSVVSYNQGWDDGISGMRVGCVIAIVLFLGFMVLGVIGLFNLAAG